MTERLYDQIAADIAEGNEDALEAHRRMCLTESKEGLSYLARGVLGMDYWKDEDTGQISRGPITWEGKTYDYRGLVDWGPHGEMLDFVTAQRPGDSVALMMTSRGGLKTSAGQARTVQKILLNPNVRGAVFMETEKKAKETVAVVRGHFESNENLLGLFGDGWVNKKAWRDDGFIVGRRTMLHLRDMTLVPYGIDSKITGGHLDFLWVDDLVSWQQARSVEQMLKGIQCFSMLQPILDPGSQTLVTMTPYDEQDLSHHLRSNLGDSVDAIVIDCGMEAVPDGKGGMTLAGEPRFPHHSEAYLLKRLQRMGPQDFNAQYAMKVTNPEDQIFHREQFVPADWEPRFAMLNAYLMTDTAVSDKDAACRSVLAVVLLDWDDTAYLADMRVGRWEPSRFQDEFMEVLLAWHPRVRFRGIVMEKTAANSVYETQLRDRMRRQGLSFDWVKIGRGTSFQSKNQRIRGLSSRFCSSKFRVLPTVPTRFEDRGRSKVLWDPGGFRDRATGRSAPGGELVESFVRFRYSGGEQLNVDIPDCLADLDTRNGKGERFLRLPPRPQSVAPDPHTLDSRARRSILTLQRQSPKPGFWSKMVR